MTQPQPPYQDWTFTPEPPRRKRGVGTKVALVAAGVAAGAVVATAIGANAATSSSTPAAAPAAAVVSTASSSTTTDPADTDNDGRAGDHDGDHGGHAGEKALSAALTAKLKAAALKAVPGGTVERVEADSGDATYEAHMTKSDGTRVTVKFNSSGTVTGVEAGMGK